MVAVDLKPLRDEKLEPVEVETAFLVVLHEGNHVQVSPDINQLVMPRRQANGADIHMACSKVTADLQADMTATLMAMKLQAQANQAVQAAQDQALRQQLKI